MKTLAQKQLVLTSTIVFVIMLIAGCEEQNKNQPQTNVDVKQARLLVSENMQLQKQLTKSQDESEKRNSENMQLQKQLAQSQDELKKSVAEAAKCGADIAKCSDELAAQKELTAEYEKQFNATPEAKMENARSEQLDSMLTMVIDENTSLTQENEKLKEQIDKLTKQLEEAKK
jgi:regulator of replication initiation timing